VPSQTQSEKIQARATSQIEQTVPEYLLDTGANLMTGDKT